MGEIFLDDLELQIASVRRKVERGLLRRRQEREKPYRRKPRDKEERRILTVIAKKKWEQAEREGKIIYFSPREWYYELEK